MTTICLYFQVHQPYRLKPYDCFKIGKDHFYEDAVTNTAILNRLADTCYLPVNKILTSLAKRHKGRFKVAFSISGTALEQFETYRTDVIQSFQKLAQTGCVEFLSETYYHSLSFVYSKDEFDRQVELHRNKIKELFHQTPVVFRNTELIYNNDLAKYIDHLGFEGILCEGVDQILDGRSPNHVYHAPHDYNFKCLLKNYRLSDDIAFRFSDRNWNEYPLSPLKFARWISQTKGDVVNLFMDYETFGEHHRKETGILTFLQKLPGAIFQFCPSVAFMTPSEIIRDHYVRGEYNVPQFSSWADKERDLSAWLGNSLQRDAMERAYELEFSVKQTENENLIAVWRKLLTSDHYYYMCTKHWQDGAIHQYFNPYHTPYDAYINFMNVLTDLEYTVESIKDQRYTERIEREIKQAATDEFDIKLAYAEPTIYS